MTTRVPATPEQLEMWLAVQREPESGRYNIALDLEFEGRVDVDALRAAVADVAARHPQLRSRFSTDGGELIREVCPPGEVPFLDRPVPGPYERNAALRHAAAAAARPLDITEAPLFRAELVRHADAALLIVVVHHLVADGWSLEVLADHLLTAYQARSEGRAPALGEPPVPADLAGTDASGAQAQAVAYWSELLAAEWTHLAPPPDLVRPGGEPGTPMHTVTRLDDVTVARLRRLCERERVSAAVIALAAWCLLVHAWSAEEDGLVGMPFAGRNDPDSHEEIGLYTRVLPVRSRFIPDRSFSEVLTALWGQVLESLQHAEVSAASLRALGAEVGGNPLAARSVFAYLREPTSKWPLPGGTVRLVAHEADAAKFDLAVAVADARDGVTLRIDYDAALYAPATAELLGDQLAELVAAAVRAPETSARKLLAGLAAFACAEGLARRDSMAEVSMSELLPELVRRRSVTRPDAVAVEHKGARLTYSELVAHAARLARWLRAQGVVEHDIVAMLLPPGTDTISAMLATAFAGAAYLPLDPAYPQAQLDLVLKDARPRLLLTVAEHAGRAAGQVPEHLIEDAVAASAGLLAEPPKVAINPGTPLNLLYTSGSAGRPKGVLLPHGGAARLMARRDFMPLDETDVVSHLSPLNFDGATYEIWGALAHGARLVVLDKELVLSPRELRAALRAHRVTTLLVTTPLLNRIVEDAPDTLQSLRRVYFGGELVSVPHIRRALAWCTLGTLLHSYGPTENSFTSTWLAIEDVAENDRTVPIGRPVPGTTLHVVFEGTFDPAPPGVPGELLLGGEGLAHGYIGDPRLTAERFVPDPFSAAPGARLYRTGDRVRRRADGVLEFIGRTDNQVKIRSQRVELGEVEAVLLAHKAVDTAFVTVWRNHRDEKEIVGYAVLGRPGALDDVRAHLRAALPAAAIPTHLIAVNELPLTANGKIDRRRLPQPPDGQAASMAEGLRAAVAPSASRHGRPRAGGSRVSAAWRDVLGPASIFGPDDNFFDVGGHSLLLVKLQEALKERTGTALTIADLLRHTTIRAHANLIGGPAGAMAVVTAELEPRAVGEPIAVIGMAGRFAGSPNLAAYWDNLVRGRDCLPDGPEPRITELPDGTRRVRRWGMLADGLAFDGALFGWMPEELAAVDAQHGIFYETLFAAAEDAGVRLSDIGPRTALYAGRSTWPAGGGSHRNRLTRADDVAGSDATFLTTRFSYWHDLWGESMLIDTGCSTSLVAVHLACASLRRGDCDYALAGGISVPHPQDGSYLYVPGHLYAEDGICRPMDRRASGTVGSDGSGAVLLRRVCDAVRDGDPIYAVISASAVNNDGRARVGYSAPGVEGQARVIRQALALAGNDGTDVDYVETHGTGTRLGDTIEAAALTEALGPDGLPVAVGSAKASIGHCNTAAGVAGLIKTVLAVHHGYLPATPHVAEPIEELARHGGRLHLLPEGRPWPERDRPRIAGVSSFGVGGTNAHVVVEQHPAAATTP